MLNALSARLLVALALVCGAAPAGAESYHVSIDTSTLAGQDGYLDFLFLGLSGAAPAQAQLSNFAGDFAASSFALGDVATGAPLSIGNGDSWNEYGQWAHFGGTLSFDVSFSNAAANGAGTTLSITLLDAGLHYAGSAGDYATFALLPGSATAIAGIDGVAISAVPEPATIVLLSTGILLLGGRARRSEVFVKKT